MDLYSSCSSQTTNAQESAEIDNLALCEGISVWSSNQEHLEQQALKELQIFVEEAKKSTEQEEGEIESDPETIREPHTVPYLDVNNYIKKQEELGKQRILLIKKGSDDLDFSKKNVLKRKSVAAGDILKSKKCKIEDESASNSQEAILQSNKVEKISAKDNCDVESSGSEYVPSEEEADSDYNPPKNRKLEGRPKKHRTEPFARVRDDGLLVNYKSRLEEYYKRLEEQESLNILKEHVDQYDILENESEEDKEYYPEYYQLKGGLKIPINLWNSLYSYQKDGIKWLWNLHQIPSGGILGDEMGLGKTVQIIVFLHSLQYSRVVSSHCRFTGLGPSLIVCPATVIHQWVKHFHEWCPEFRVSILHQSGSYQGNKGNLIKEMHKDKGIIITTYLGILKFKGNLLEHTWHYIILDEGHKIRNSASKVSVAVKQLRTPHRLLLTGSPMQNNLAELWSLFDFTNPGMLGNLPTFQEHFASPILQGGFANASPMQEATALSVATTLKNIISPYLLRRMKSEVNHYLCLPDKNEQVLFCSLTDDQMRLYKDFLMSEQINSILGRGIKNWFADKLTRGNVLVSITTLRKICNHPDLYHGSDGDISEESYGFYKKSGKMIVVATLLKIWKKQGHRVLLFTQGRSMILIFEDFLQQHGYKYLKMDGSTGVSSRQPLIDRFNNDSSYEVFLLTTRVGGLGVNLTGANRVIIYDPDWNPATDTQARERAWRIGQNKQVTIYRLLSAGTIEEKMYQRQVWKQLLGNKVLIDPSTNKFFKSSDLHDLFSLQETPHSNPETANIFHASRVKMQKRYKAKQKKNKEHTNDETDANDLQFSEDKIQAMKNLAQKIAKSLNEKKESEEFKEKNAYQKELEEQRKQKQKEKEKLKQLTPQELIEYNRIKGLMKEDENINRLDDNEANVSFEKALQYSEKKSKSYRKLKHQHSIEQSSSKQEASTEYKEERKHKKKGNKEKVIVDTSGKIDGEQVDGLVKSEIKLKRDTDNSKSDQTHDNYVLEYLFTKRGVSDALHHDSVIESKCRSHGLKVNFEAKQRAEKALEALKKSRLNKWSW